MVEYVVIYSTCPQNLMIGHFPLFLAYASLKTILTNK